MHTHFQAHLTCHVRAKCAHLFTDDAVSAYAADAVRLVELELLIFVVVLTKFNEAVNCFSIAARSLMAICPP
jgi:hypothetical protein